MNLSLMSVSQQIMLPGVETLHPTLIPSIMPCHRVIIDLVDVTERPWACCHPGVRTQHIVPHSSTCLFFIWVLTSLFGADFPYSD